MGQAPSPKAIQLSESGGQPESKARPESGRRGPGEKNIEAKCIACNKGKRKGIPPKARWKEEQKEKTQGSRELRKEESESGTRGGCVATEMKGKENRADIAPNSGGTVAVPVQGCARPRSIFKGIKGSTKSAAGVAPKMPVACLSGIPRDLAQAGTVQRVAPTGSGINPRSISNEINQQVLHSKYKFKENAPLKEYLRQRVPAFREVHTLREMLTMLKDIIRDNFLFDENNPSMIDGDPPLEAALGKREVSVNEIRSVVHRQLTLVEVCPGPLAVNVLAGGMAMLTGAVSAPRAEGRTAPGLVSTPNGGAIMDFRRIPSGSIVTLEEVRAAGSAPGERTRIIGTVTYVPQARGNGDMAPPQPETGQGRGGVPVVQASTVPGVPGVRAPMASQGPDAAGASRLSREAAANIRQIIVTLTLLLANAGQSDGLLAYDCRNVRGAVRSYALTPLEGCWMEQAQHPAPEPQNGRILWMRDGARFPVICCKMTETTMRADCDVTGRVGPWKVTTSEKQVPIGPMSCLEMLISREVVLFNRTMTLTAKGTAMEVLEERINYSSKGNCPSPKKRNAAREAYAKLTVRRIMVWEHKATESLIKKTITMGTSWPAGWTPWRAPTSGITP
jgi:hypothetical protein